MKFPSLSLISLVTSKEAFSAPSCSKFSPIANNYSARFCTSSCKLKDDQVVPLSEMRFSGELPKDRIKRKFTLASGPGGMNINKIATKAEIRFRVDEADWIPKRLREHFAQKYANDINKENEWIMTSMVARTQMDNLEDCYRKLRRALEDASAELVLRARRPTDEDVAIVEAKKEKSDEYRRVMKQRTAFKKRNRRLFE